MINDNVSKGVSYDGNKFEYSTNTYARPYDSKLVQKMGGVQAEGKLYDIATSKSTGKLTLLIHGYKDFKAKVYPDVANDFLTVSGKMLRNLSVVNVSKQKQEFVIGFTDPEQELKAFWLQVSGVGRSRRLWKFLGLSNAQQKELANQARYWLANDTEFNAIIGGEVQRYWK